MRKRIVIFIGFILLPSIALIFFNQNHFFFWDTIQLGAQHALWFYNHRLNVFFLPEYIDSGHIPAFGYYLAVVWRILGKSIIVSHWAMLPFLVLIFYFIIKISSLYSHRNSRYLLVFLLIIEPTLLTQLTLISPDVPLVAFFLWHWWAIETRKYKQRSFSAAFLVLISLRGSIVLFILELYFFIIDNKKWRILFKKHFVPLIPAILIFGAYQYFHWLRVAWVFWHSDSPWADSFEWAGLYTILLNSFLYVWRMVDFGRWVIWFFLFLYFVLYKLKYYRSINKRVKNLVLLLTLLFVGFYIIVVFHSSLLAHRYFISIYLVSIVLLFQLLNNFFINKWVIYSVLVFSLLSGHLWIYPEKIAQGWDASLAHQPYFDLRKEVLLKMDSLHISRDKVGSDFPNLAKESEITLSSVDGNFHPYDINLDSLIFYSNIFNNFTDQELKALDTWTKLFEVNKRGVKIILYKK